MESPSWFFLLFGFVGLPAVGYYLGTALSKIGFDPTQAKPFGFFLFPCLLLMMDVPAFLMGRAKGNLMLKRGGQQGLLAVAGFVLGVCLLFALGKLSDLAGL